jgi:hypothetical protein
MLHSGSRGVGMAKGTHCIALANKDAELHPRNVPDQDLALPSALQPAALGGRGWVFAQIKAAQSKLQTEAGFRCHEIRER